MAGPTLPSGGVVVNIQHQVTRSSKQRLQDHLRVISVGCDQGVEETLLKLGTFMIYALSSSLPPTRAGQCSHIFQLHRE